MKQKVNILSVKFGSDYIIYCPFQILSIWPYLIWWVRYFSLIFSLDFKFYVGLFDIFEIDVHFCIISELFSELKFLNFFANISWVQKFCFFPKNFRTLTAEHFQNSRKRKVQKIPSNAGPYKKWLSEVP